MTAAASPDLSGLWVPLVTPFDADDRIDHAALRRLCARVLSEGARGVVALGTTAEPATLTADERRAVISTCAEACAPHDDALIVGPGTNSTRTTVEGTQQLRDIPGVAAALVVVPYYTRPTPTSIVEHYRVVADESPVPIVAYNVPARTGRGLDARALLEIAHLPNVAGLKQAVGAVDGDTLELLRTAPRSFQVLAGDDAFIAPTMLMGGVGAIAASAHVLTPMFVALVDAARRGDVPEARRSAELLLPIVDAGFAEPNPACWKAALHQHGEIASPALRSPMAAATENGTRRLVDAIAAARSSCGL
jgi:4-hydroxy-tetrahydrodipicolinate synthase